VLFVASHLKPWIPSVLQRSICDAAHHIAEQRSAPAGGHVSNPHPQC
jgi:hypothetical protein